MPGLDKLIRDYYQSQALDDARVDAILQRAAAQNPRNPRRRMASWAPLAACLAVCLVAVLLHIQISQRNVTAWVLSEVAMNHAEALSPEVLSDHYPAIRQGLEQLDFELTPPAPGTIPAGVQLVGGRYCSIYGELAAQLSFMDPGSGARYTLFITPLTDSLEEIGGGHGQHDGVDIRLWHGEKLFYALAVDGS